VVNPSNFLRPGHRPVNIDEANRRGKIQVQHVVHIVSQVGDALAYAHARGVIHRDVKPSNILLTDIGRVLLADFGIAAAPNAANDSAGTRGYLAPERRDGKPIDVRTDIFSLGVMLYELLSGKRFGEQNILTRSLAANKLPPPSHRVVCPGWRGPCALRFVFDG
jgi:serine/threonine protein kinase